MWTGRSTPTIRPGCGGPDRAVGNSAANPRAITHRTGYGVDDGGCSWLKQACIASLDGFGPRRWKHWVASGCVSPWSVTEPDALDELTAPPRKAPNSPLSG